MQGGLILVGIILLVIGGFLIVSLIGAFIGGPLAFIGFILILVGLFSGGSNPKVVVHQQVSQNSELNDELKILKRRLAKGEITKKEYNELKRELE